MADEQTQTTQEISSDTTGSTQEGNIPPVLDKVERAELAVKKLEETEKRIEEKLARLTELEANRILGGTAGGRVETKPKIETDKEYTKRIEKEIAEGKFN